MLSFEQNAYTFIKYRKSQIEGQCTLKTIEAIKLNTLKLILFSIFCILFLGIPLVVSYLYAKFQRWCYYDFCKLNQATHFFIENYDNIHTIVSKEAEMIYFNPNQHKECIYFFNRNLKYYYNQQQQYFTALTYNYNERISQIFQEKEKIRGYNKEAVINLRKSFGQCSMKIPPPGAFVLFIRQILQPYFLFLIISVFIYYQRFQQEYASILLFTSALIVVISLYKITQLNRTIFEMAFYSTQVIILRQKQIIQTSSVNVVPGDLILLKYQMKLPFDAILLGGSILVNESSLSGQTIPIIKKAVFANDKNILQYSKDNIIYEGTRFIQVCSYNSNPLQKQFQEYGILVCVIRTNFHTIRGQLVRITTFPKVKQSKFLTQSFKFMLALSFLGLITFLSTLPISQLVYTNQGLFYYFLEILVITTSPGIPISLNVGIWYSLFKLKKHQISCISPDRIMNGGRVEYVCFDKTGTMTQDTMKFQLILPYYDHKFREPLSLDFANQLQLQHSKLQLIFCNIGICHSINKLDSQIQEFVGDPVEIQLFHRFGKFKAIAPTCKYLKNKQMLFSCKNKNFEGIMLKRFQFSTQLHRMSTIGLFNFQPQTPYVLCKGSPESIFKILKKKSKQQQSIYFNTLKNYTKKGLRVLAIASKSIKFNQIEKKSRDSIESQLQFNGFQLFQNKLKQQTHQVIQILRKAEISMTMITGDNLHTASTIALQSQLVSRENSIILCERNNENTITLSKMEYQSQITQWKNETNRQLTNTNQTNFDLVKLKDIKQLLQKARQFKVKDQNIIFSICSPLFNQIFDIHDQFYEEKIQFFKNIKVFARAKPNDKTKIISMYQDLGIIVAMCGDGANDSGALKQANVGLILGQLQSSISSTFTSQKNNLHAIIKLIQQCRAGLSLNFCYFNIMATFSLILYTSEIIKLEYYSQTTAARYFYIYIFHNFIFFLTIGRSQSAQELSIEKPNENIFGISNLVSIISMMLMQALGQISIIMLMTTPRYSEMLNYSNLGGRDNNLLYLQFAVFSNVTPEIQAVFYFSNFQYTFSVIAVTISTFFKPFYTNCIFTPLLIFTFIYDILLCVYPNSRLNIFQLTSDTFPQCEFQILLVILAIIFGILMIIIHKYVVQVLFNKLKAKYPDKAWL